VSHVADEARARQVCGEPAWRTALSHIVKSGAEFVAGRSAADRSAPLTAQGSAHSPAADEREQGGEQGEGGRFVHGDGQADVVQRLVMPSKLAVA
jgi:hypothetical protein